MSSACNFWHCRNCFYIVLGIFLMNFVRIGSSSSFPVCTPMDKTIKRDESSTMIMMVILQSPSVSEVRASLGRKTSPTETDAIVESLKSEQESLKDMIENVGGEVLGQYQFAMDGIKVRIAKDQVDCLKTLPHVRDVLPVGTYHLLEGS